MRKAAALVLAGLLLLLSVSMTAAADGPAVEEVSVRVRDVITLRPNYTTPNSPKHEWRSSDETVATVERAGGYASANVTGRKPGLATITALDDGKEIARYRVTVLDAPLPEEITMPDRLIVAPNAVVDLSFTVRPADATVLYEAASDNLRVLSCKTTAGGAGVRITGRTPGAANLTVRASGGIVLTAAVYVISAESERFLLARADGGQAIPVYYDRAADLVTVLQETGDAPIVFVALYDAAGRMTDVREIRSHGMAAAAGTASVGVFALSPAGVPLGAPVRIQTHPPA